MLLVSCGTDLKLHNCLSYELAHVYRPADSSGQIRNISWCKDGSWLALVPSRGNAEIIRTKDDIRLLQSILGVSQPTTAVFQRTTKKNVAMSTVNGGVLIYDIKARSIKKQFANSGSSVTMLDWSVKDSHLAAGSTDGQVTLYSNTTNQKTSVISLPGSKSVSVVRFHSTQRLLLGTASDEGVVVVWDINGSKKKLSLKPHKAPVTDLAFSSQNKNLMISVGLDRTFQCYDINAGIVALTVLTDHPLSAIDLAPDGYTVAVASSRGNIYVYDLRDHQKPLATIAAHSGEIKKVLFQPFPSDNFMESINITEDKPTDLISPLATRIASTDSFINVNEFSPKIDADFNGMDQDMEVKIRSGSAGGDSFFSYLDNCNSNKRVSGSFAKEKSEISNLGISDGVKKWLDSKNLEATSSQSTCESNHEKISDVLPILTVKPSSSTPRQNMNRIAQVFNQEMSSSNISPIMVTGPQLPEDMSKVIKNVVSEVVNGHMSDLMDNLSSHFLNLQLSFSKQFVNQEDHIDRLFHYLQNSSANTNLSMQVQQLQQENEFLKSKINELMKKTNS